jgi:hypothetical protein
VRLGGWGHQTDGVEGAAFSGLIVSRAEGVTGQS